MKTVAICPECGNRFESDILLTANEYDLHPSATLAGAGAARVQDLRTAPRVTMSWRMLAFAAICGAALWSLGVVSAIAIWGKAHP